MDILNRVRLLTQRKSLFSYEIRAYGLKFFGIFFVYTKICVLNLTEIAAVAVDCYMILCEVKIIKMGRNVGHNEKCCIFASQNVAHVA